MKPQGFSLVELLVTVTVVGLLSAIALPSYRQYTLRAQRSEAKSELLQSSAALERCFGRFNAYNHPDCASMTVLPRTLPSGNYEIVAAELSAGNYRLNAVPQGGQADDQECQALSLDSSNNKTVSASATKPARYCWSH